MIKNLNLPSEIASQLSLLSQQSGLNEDQLILEAILNYLEDFEDRKDAEESLLNPPNQYLSLEEVEKELDLAD